MIGLDTNILVRFLVDDDPEQGLLASQVLQAMVRRGEKGFVPDIVLAELAWVLERSYQFSRAQITGIFRQLLHARQLVFRNRDELRNALDQYQAGGGLADHLLAEQAGAAGCSVLVTFDRKLQRRPDCISPSEYEA